MRDVGYDLPTSIADLVDNSIEAGATEVWIDFYYNGEDSYIRIADNGCGMSSQEIDEALRYGSKRNYGRSDLGKFGLGLKTASLSHCRKLTVASRRRHETDPSIIVWDLDHVSSTDKWEAIKLSVEEANPILNEWLQKTQGTIVLWEKLDRILSNKVDGRKTTRENFAAMCRQIEEHLAMVFHRFLDGEAKRKLPLSLYINGNKIQAWDPFVKSEPETRILQKHNLVFNQNDHQVSVLVQPYILPHESMFSSKAAHAAAAGPKKWNRQQGLYIYRNDRLIQSGGWNRLRAADEHTKLARIAIDFDSSADEAFQIDIAKMKVQIPSAIRKELQEITTTVASVANTVYREKGFPKVKSLGRPRDVKPPGTGERKLVVKKDPFINTFTGNSEAKGTKTIDHSAKTNKQDTSDTGKTNQTAVETNSKKTSGKNEGKDNLVKIVVSVLNRELSDNPELLNRVLNELARVSTAFRMNREAL